MKAIEYYLHHWALIPDGEVIITQTSKIFPVRYKNMPAMLKIAQSTEERRGGQLMVWWNGQGVAQLYAHDDQAFLMERAIGEQSLVTLAKHQDSEATLIICSVVEKLHSIKNDMPLPEITPLLIWFKSLEIAAAQHNGIFSQANQIAQKLLNKSQASVVLHGDIHHANILDFGKNDWRAIDPKGLIGERGYDYANIFCNPNADIALSPGRLEKQINVVSKAANIEPSRLLKWIIAYAGLSAAWHLEDQNNPELALVIAEKALALQQH